MNVKTSGRLVRRVYYIDGRDWDDQRPREVDDDATAASVLTEGDLPQHMLGLRFKSVLVVDATMPDGEVVTFERAVRVGSRFLIGQLVDMSYLRSVVDTHPLGITGIGQLIDRLKGDASSRVFLSERGRLHPIDDGSVVVDRAGNIVKEILSAPADWIQSALFQGSEFRVEILGDIVKVVAQNRHQSHTGRVHLDFHNPGRGLPDRVMEAAHLTTVWIDAMATTLVFDKPCEVVIDVDGDGNRHLHLAWDSEQSTLTARFKTNRD